MKKLFIPVIIGTAREGNQSIKAANLIAKTAEEFSEIKAQIIDPAKFNFNKDGREEESVDSNYLQIAGKADGFFIVIPEYSHGYPGSLKRLLDSAYEEYKYKPVAFAGVSSGPYGGVRGIENLLPVVRSLGMIASFSDVHFPKIGNLFDKKGRLQDSSYIDRVKKSWKELIFLAKIFQKARK